MLAHANAYVLVTQRVGTSLQSKDLFSNAHKASAQKALQALHLHGAAHGDVRRENLVFSEDGDQCWLIDLEDAVLNASQQHMDEDMQCLCLAAR